VGRLPI